MRKSFSPSPVRKRLITSLGRTTPSEFPNLRTLSSTTETPLNCYYNCNNAQTGWQEEIFEACGQGYFSGLDNTGAGGRPFCTKGNLDEYPTSNFCCLSARDCSPVQCSRLSSSGDRFS